MASITHKKKLQLDFIMIKKIFPLLATAVIGTLGFTSCLDVTDERQDVTLTYAGELCFNRITDLESGDVSYSLNPTYNMLFDQIGNKVTVDMSNIQLSTMFSGLAFKLPEIDYKYNSETAFFEASGKDLTPQNAAGSYVFSHFSLKTIPGRIVQSTQAPVYLIDFTLNNRYRITAFPVAPVLVGELNASNVNGDTEPFRTTDSYLTLRVFPERMSANIVIGASKFASDMMITDFVVKDVPLQCTDSGYTISLPADDIRQLYYTNDKPFEGCTVSNLAISFDLESGATTLTGIFDVYNRLGDDFDPAQTFDVKMSLSYLFLVEN